MRKIVPALAVLLAAAVPTASVATAQTRSERFRSSTHRPPSPNRCTA